MKRFIRDTYRKQILISTMDTGGSEREYISVIINSFLSPQEGGWGG